MPHPLPRFNAYFIETRDDGSFRFLSKDGGGKPHACLNINDRYGEWCDILAWRVDNPGRWWLRYGDETPILGAKVLAWASEEVHDIVLHETPEGWIMGRMRGVCVIDWRCDLRALFEGVNKIVCESQALNRQLWKALHQNPNAPKVTTARGARRA